MKIANLARTHQKAEAGEPVRSWPKTTSFQYWAEHLTAFTEGDPLDGEAPPRRPRCRRRCLAQNPLTGETAHRDDTPRPLIAGTLA